MFTYTAHSDAKIYRCSITEDYMIDKLFLAGYCSIILDTTDERFTIDIVTEDSLLNG